jgi:leader peptidase (prepilin peptidase)/N-methyltransferase
VEPEPPEAPVQLDERSGRVDVEVDAPPSDAAMTRGEAAPVRSPVVDRDPVDWPALAATRGLAGWCALTAALAAGSVAWVLGDDPSLPAWTALCVVGTWLAYIDWRTRLLPKRLVLPTYGVIGVALLVAGLVSGDTDALVRAGVGWLATFAVYALLWLLHPRGLGYGDVRLSGVLGMTLGWIGWSALVVGAYAGFLLGAVIGGLLALAKVVDRRGYPFGPFMLAGAWLGAVTSPLTAGWV